MINFGNYMPQQRIQNQAITVTAENNSTTKEEVIAAIGIQNYNDNRSPNQNFVSHIANERPLLTEDIISIRGDISLDGEPVYVVFPKNVKADCRLVSAGFVEFSLGKFIAAAPDARVVAQTAEAEVDHSHPDARSYPFNPPYSNRDTLDNEGYVRRQLDAGYITFEQVLSIPVQDQYPSLDDGYVCRHLSIDQFYSMEGQLPPSGPTCPTLDTDEGAENSIDGNDTENPSSGSPGLYAAFTQAASSALSEVFAQFLPQAVQI